MSKLLEVTTNEEWAEHLSTIPPSTLQIIYFKADWALPCQQMTTVLETLASSYPVTEPLSTSWLSLDAEEVIDISDSFNVTAVPYVVLRRGTLILETLSGSDTTRVRLAIEKYTNDPSAPAAVPAVSLIDESSETEPTNIESSPAAVEETATATSPETKSKEEIFKRIARLVKIAPVMLFMKGIPNAPECGFSRQIVSLLRENNVKFGYFNILADDEVRQGLKEFADWPTYPQLWIQGELVGGLDIVKEELETNPDFLKSCIESTNGVSETSTSSP